MIEAVIFDMDGVLFDTENMTLKLWKKLCKEMNCADVTQHPEEFMGMNSDQIHKHFLDRFGVDFPYEEFMRRGRKYAEEEVQAKGVPVKPGLYKLLDYLKQNGFLIAAASSTKRVTVLQYFESAGITGYFNRIICGDMVEKSKPDPDIYLKAASALGVNPHSCMAVEDSPNGIASAWSAGMKTVMVPDLVPPNPRLNQMLYACVPTLADIIPLLERE